MNPSLPMDSFHPLNLIRHRGLKAECTHSTDTIEITISNKKLRIIKLPTKINIWIISQLQPGEQGFVLQELNDQQLHVHLCIPATVLRYPIKLQQQQKLAHFAPQPEFTVHNTSRRVGRW